MRRGQIWSNDYILGFFLFFIALLIASSVLVRTVLQQDSFDDVLNAAYRGVEQLMTEGYPPDWRVDDIISAGVMTDDRLSMQKLEGLLVLDRDSPWNIKSLIDTSYEYALWIEERNGSVVPIADACVLGTADVVRTPITVNQSVAFYYRGGGSQSFKLTAQAVNATLYTDNEFPLLLEEIHDYDILILENPDLANVLPPYDSEKADKLEEYVLRGGELLIIGNLNLTEAFDLNMSLFLSSNATGTNATNPYLNLTGVDIDGITGAYALTENGQRRYESLAERDGRDFAAQFTHGDGRVTFLGGLNGTITLPLVQHVAISFIGTIPEASARCTSVTTPTDNVKHLVVVKRLAAYKGTIRTLTLTIWEDS